MESTEKCSFFFFFSSFCFIFVFAYARVVGGVVGGVQLKKDMYESSREALRRKFFLSSWNGRKEGREVEVRILSVQIRHFSCTEQNKQTDG